MTHKTCTTCAVSLPLAKFTKNRSLPGGLSIYCRTCCNQRCRTYHAENGALVKTKRDRTRITPEGRAKRLFDAAQTRAQERGYDFDLTPEWIFERIAAGHCEATGIPFDFGVDGRGSGYKKSFGPSLDRTETMSGYTKANTKVVVWAYNAAKGTGTHADVVKLAEALHGR